MRYERPLRALTLFGLVVALGCARSDEAPSSADIVPLPEITPATAFDKDLRPYTLAGPLIPASVTMVSAWDIPKNPLVDPTLEGSARGEQVRWGFRLFMSTPSEAPDWAPGRMSCGNCHLNAGQRERALPLVGSAGMFPEYNRRAGRDFTLEERIVGCFLRSENATGGLTDSPGLPAATPLNPALPSSESAEVQALAAYIRWLSDGYPAGENPPWRGQNAIARDALIPVDQMDPEKGQALYAEHCASCHGEDGQGVQIADKKAGPLWGQDSWNDGAGAARVYTLAGIIRYMMPYLDPGRLTDEEAQHIAAFITSRPRPVYPFKDQDYAGEPPVDAVYYRPTPTNP